MTPTPSLRVDGELTIYRAAELRSEFISALDGVADGGELAIDLSAVTEMDSAGAQLLVAARRTAHASRRRLRLVAPSPAVADVLELLQLSSHFADTALVAP